MHRPVLVITHAPWETPALIDTVLDAAPTLRRTVLDEPAPELPHPRDLGGLVVMGGPQDADDDAGHPGLAAERRLLAAAVDDDVPVLAVCLGMQLLALALGSPLHRGHGTEIGFAPVSLTPAGRPDPVLGPLADDEGGLPAVLHWHQDAVDLPPGAELLASTPLTPVQAFRAGSALATQFHPEADAALVATWLAEPAMAAAMPAGAAPRIEADAARVLPGLEPRALAGLATFATAVAERRG